MNARRNHRNRRSNKSARTLFVEQLEQRAMMHGGDWGAAENASLGFAIVDAESPYLPPQHRLTNPAGLLSGRASGDPFTVATQFLMDHAEELGLNIGDLGGLVVTDRYADDSSGITHLYLRQTVDGREVIDGDLGVHLTSHGEVIQVSSSFVTNARVVGPFGPQYIMSAVKAFSAFSNEIGWQPDSVPSIVGVDSRTESAATVLSAGGTPWADIPAELVYLPTAAGLQLTWRFDLHTPDYSYWVDAFVDADTGQLLQFDNLIENASYNVFAWPSVSPINGSRSIAVDPQEATASPYGWHDTNGLNGAEYTDTRGNNVTAQEDVNGDDLGGTRPSGDAGLTFDFPYDPAQDPALYQSAALTNAFYWVNLLHDIHYQYGFTEAAGNFQANNYGRGGIGNDLVIVDIQDGDGGSDGFAALPDGQSPRMSLYRRSSPYRDSAFDSEVIVHEFGHGVSERLTGGPGNVRALNATQSKAMGEGWGDFYALALLQVPSDGKLDAYGIGNYAAGYAANGPGIRPYPYSFDKSVNPLTYGAYNGDAANRQSHKAGAIWASALWDMNWLLIDKHGFSSDLLHGAGGNNLALQLVMDGMKLQGTNPSFLAGRDAILAADRVRTGGKNQAEIWAAFARRGMGFGASDGGSAGATAVVEAFDVPGTISGTVFRDDDANGMQSGSESGLADWTVYLDTNNNGMPDTATTVVYNSTDTPKTITDHGITYSHLAVSGLAGVITDIDVTVNLTHPYDGELYLTLISPANTPVIMANYLGGSGDNYTNTTFDDEATTYISSGTAPFTGAYKPYYNLSQLDGRDPNGTWKLRMDDAVAGNSGQLLNWSMRITYGSPEPTAVTDADGRYTFFGLGDGTHHVREIVRPGFIPTLPLGGSRDATVVGGVSVIDANFGNRADEQPPVISSLTSLAESCAVSLTSPVMITGTYADSDSSAHTVLIDWGDGSTSPAAVDSVQRKFTATHRYAPPGVASSASSYVVTATISDGSQQDSKSVSVRTTGAFLMNGVLEVMGTGLADTVVVRPVTSQQLVVEFFPIPTDRSLVFSYPFPSADVSSIRVEMCAGNDKVTVQSLSLVPVTISGGGGADTVVSGAGPAILIGGEGNDMLRAGPGGAVLVGGGGTDYLYGGSGRDLIIGGLAADYVVGQSTDDILIGGTTSYDLDVPALAAIQAKWREPTPMSTRIAELDAGIVLGARTVRLKKTITVFDDGVVDSVFGSPTSNWRLDT